MNEGPPLRLRDDPTVAGSLRADLARVSAQTPMVWNAARSLARFEQALRVGGASAGAATGTILGASLKGALLAVAVVGAAAVVDSRSPEASLPAPIMSMAPVTPAPSPVPRTPVPRAPVVVAPDVTTAALAPPAISARASATPVVALPAARADDPGLPLERADPSSAPVGAEMAAPPTPIGKDDALAAELAHLVRLRALEGSDPAQALALVAEGSRRFPTGIFVQEREAIAIGALVRLGRLPEAQARARSFVAAFPRSAFTERIKRLTGIDNPQ